MSTNGNGHLPEGATLVTLAQLQSVNTKHVQAKGLSERLGTEVYVRIRAIRRSTYLQMLPPQPPGSTEWPKEDAEYLARLNAWVVSLPPAEQDQRKRAYDEITYKVVAAGVADPPMTMDQARDLGNDADDIAVAIMDFSGLLAKPAVVEAEVAPAS
jgi:hypothetical protein